MLNKVIKYVLNRDYRFLVNNRLGFHKNMSDELFVKKMFKVQLGKNLNLDSPKTYNEKIQWIKLYDHNPIYNKLVDKYNVKSYVASKIGEDYIIPTIGIWDKFEDIDFEILPNQFVLKCTHDSGSVVICKDKSKFDIKKAKKKINSSMKHNYYYTSREWAYKFVKPRIIAEEYMEDSQDKELRDYKFFCFDGKPHVLLVVSNRQSMKKETCFDFYDMNFNHKNLVSYYHPNSSEQLHKPICFDKMKDLASILSVGITEVRIDFYEVNGRVYFGECTFYHMGGFEKAYPYDWELEWGDLIKLPI